MDEPDFSVDPAAARVEESHRSQTACGVLQFLCPLEESCSLKLLIPLARCEHVLVGIQRKATYSLLHCVQRVNHENPL